MYYLFDFFGKFDFEGSASELSWQSAHSGWDNHTFPFFLLFFSKETGNAEILVKWLRVHVALLTKSTVWLNIF